MGGVSLAWASPLYLNIKCRLLRGFCILCLIPNIIHFLTLYLTHCLSSHIE